MADANITTPKTAPGGMETAIAELDATINYLSRQPETDKAATAAMISATTARATLRDLTYSLRESMAVERRYATHYWTVCHELNWPGTIELPAFAKKYDQFEGGMEALHKVRDSIDCLMFGEPRWQFFDIDGEEVAEVAHG